MDLSRRLTAIFLLGVALLLRPSSPAVASDGVWKEIPLFNARAGHGAVYDARRGRMIVFGGMEMDRGGLSAKALPNDVWALSLVGAPQWTQLFPRGTPPPGMDQPALVYDPLRDRMWVVAGRVWSLSLQGHPEWKELTQLEPAPTGPVVYDSTRDRLLVVGQSVWAMPLNGPFEWVELSSPGTGPPSASAAIYDPLRERLLVFRAYEPDDWRLPTTTDVWAFALTDRPEWTRLGPVGTAPDPPRLGDRARLPLSALYDPVRDRSIVIEGYAEEQLRLWALSLGSTPEWTMLSTRGSPSHSGRDRRGFSVVLDPRHDRLVVFGGSEYQKGGDRGLPDVWELRLAGDLQWMELRASGVAPGARFGQAAVWDSRRDQMVLFGGSRGPSSPALNDVYVLSLGKKSKGTRVFPEGTPPPGEFYIGVADAAHDRMLLFRSGGAVWALSLGDSPSWAELARDGSGPRVVEAVICDPARDRVLAHGASEVWEFPLARGSQWGRVEARGAPPAAHVEHWAVYDSMRDRMLVFKGRGSSSGEGVDPVWSLSLSGTSEWTQFTPRGSPPADDHAPYEAFYDERRDRIVLQGTGVPSWEPGTWILSLTEPIEWRPLDVESAPIGRQDHATVYDPRQDRMLMFGGLDPEEDFICSDLWALQFTMPPNASSTSSTASGSRHLGIPFEKSLALHGPKTKVVIGSEVEVLFSLRDAQAAELALYDVAGRVLDSVPVGHLAAGNHSVRLGRHPLSPGVYWVRLTQGREAVSRKICVLR